MLLLLLDSLLLIFITFSLGSISKYLLGKLFGFNVQSTFLEDFLLGLIFSAIYFNCLSFFIPVNFLVLIPILLISILWQWKTKSIKFSGIKEFLKQYFTDAQHRLWLFLIFLIVAIYFLIPPINHDSADYHYHAVYWYETQKVIPGLANVHGRLGFNAVIFILSAPYAFSEVIGQSIYPVNGVLVFFFYLWLLKRIIQKKEKWSSVVYLISGILLFRPLLANIPSPASEPMVIITAITVMLRLVELIEEKKFRYPAYLIVPVVLCFFSITAKLTSLPLLLVPAVWILFIMQKQQFGFYLKTAGIIILIMVPWLARNVILSGYILYPLYQIDLFNVDWKVPKDVAAFDYALGTFGSKADINKGVLTQKPFEWFIPWIMRHFQAKRIVDFIVLLLCFTSPITWLIVRYKQKANKFLFLLWCCLFIASMVWLFQAPEYRFGMSFLIGCFCIPLINLGDKQISLKRSGKILTFLFLFSIFYYSIRAVVVHPRMHTIGIEKLWLKPLKDKRYYKPIDFSTFKYDDLGNGVRLYYKDSTHDCIGIMGEPCMLWYYGKIEMRGNKISDGFRNVTDEIRKIFPWAYVREW